MPEHHPLPHGLRMTAADRPGVAQPVPVRDIPDRPWKRMLVAVLLLTVALTGIWEWRMRAIGLVPGDIGDSLENWAELRRRIDREDVPIVLIGDSRIKLGVDLQRIRALTGLNPLQLGMIGGGGLPVLEDIAADRNFRGVAIVGGNDQLYYRPEAPKPIRAVKMARWEAPSTTVSYHLGLWLQQRLALLDANYELGKLVFRLDRNWRAGVLGPYDEDWKMEENRRDGQAWIWRRIETDRWMRAHARHTWFRYTDTTPLPEAKLNEVLRRTRRAVETVRAHGGEVVFLHPPVGQPFRAMEDRNLSRQRGWDRLLSYTHSVGAHSDDLPNAQHLDMPEDYHISRACETVFTDVFIRYLAARTNRLRLRHDAPPPLDTADCTGLRTR